MKCLLAGPSVTPRSSGFGGGSGTPRASGSVATPRGGGGYPGGVTPGGSTPRSVPFTKNEPFFLIFDAAINNFLKGPMDELLAVVRNKVLVAQQGWF